MTAGCYSFFPALSLFPSLCRKVATRVFEYAIQPVVHFHPSCTGRAILTAKNITAQLCCHAGEVQPRLHTIPSHLHVEAWTLLVQQVLQPFSHLDGSLRAAPHTTAVKAAALVCTLAIVYVIKRIRFKNVLVSLEDVD